MNRPVRSITIGTTLWGLLVLVLWAVIMSPNRTSRPSDFQTRFVASPAGGGWTLVPAGQSVWGGNEVNITALAYTDPAAPWPLLLPLTQSRSCHIWMRSGSGAAISSVDQRILEGLVSAQLAADPAWAGYPTAQGGRTYRIPWIQAVGALLLWSILGVLLVCLILRIDRHWRRPKPFRCSICDYPTLGLPTNTCPECGGDIQAKPRQNGR